MEGPININMIDRSNILVREERTTLRDPLYGKETPGKPITIERRFISHIIPILKAFVIITLFVMNGSGYSPLGCKIQYLMSDKFWFNKQIIIFFIIYFIINLGGETISKLTNPIQQLIISICTLILYNIIARLGDIWWDKNPWYWPGPMSWFAILVFPLLSIYILDDLRKYYIAENASLIYGNSIDAIKSIEIGMILVSLVLIVWGFLKAVLEARGKYKAAFSFFKFLFGGPLTEDSACSGMDFNKYKKELKTNNKKTNIFGSTILVGLILFVTFSIGYVAVYKSKIEKYFKLLNNKLRNRYTKDKLQ